MCRLGADPPRDGIVRTSPGPEGSKDKGALPGARRILNFAPVGCLRPGRWKMPTGARKVRM